ncbi:MAG: HD domain-containing protein, partial [Planctomycetota bacterium]
MYRSLSSRSSVRRLLETGFTAADLGESLISFDADHPAEPLRQWMEEHALRVVGVREEGSVVGYVLRDGLKSGRCGDESCLQRFGTDDLIESDASLREIVIGLESRPFLFIKLLGQVGGIITRTDLQKPPARMWLFGLMTLVEQALAELIAARWPDDGWMDQLSSGRLELARRLQAERERRNEHVDLIDCLQFADKAHIAFKDARVRERLGIESSSRARTVIRNMERLRNSLAHAQDLLGSNWRTIFKLASQLEDVLDRL